MRLFWSRAHQFSQTQKSLESHLKPMPIIVGSLRSGTTLLRFMLDSHSELTIPPETGFLALAPKLRGRGDKLREKFLRAVINHPQPISAWPDFEIPEGAFWTALTGSIPSTSPKGSGHSIDCTRHALGNRDGVIRRRFIARNWIRSDEFYRRGVLFTSSVTAATPLSR